MSNINVNTNENDDEFDTTESGNHEEEVSEEEWLVSFVKIQPGETVVYGFSTDKGKRKMIKKDFGSGPVKAIVFMVTTPDEPGVEKEFRITSKNLARQIIRYLDKGITDLQISRKGKGKFDTSYEVVALGEAPVARTQKRL